MTKTHLSTLLGIIALSTGFITVSEAMRSQQEAQEPAAPVNRPISVASHSSVPVQQAPVRAPSMAQQQPQPQQDAAPVVRQVSTLSVTNVQVQAPGRVPSTVQSQPQQPVVNRAPSLVQQPQQPAAVNRVPSLTQQQPQQPAASTGVVASPVVLPQQPQQPAVSAAVPAVFKLTEADRSSLQAAGFKPGTINALISGTRVLTPDELKRFQRDFMAKSAASSASTTLKVAAQGASSTQVAQLTRVQEVLATVQALKGRSYTQAEVSGAASRLVTHPVLAQFADQSARHYADPQTVSAVQARVSGLPAFQMYVATLSADEVTLLLQSLVAKEGRIAAKIALTADTNDMNALRALLADKTVEKAVQKVKETCEALAVVVPAQSAHLLAVAQNVTPAMALGSSLAETTFTALEAASATVPGIDWAVIAPVLQAGIKGEMADIQTRFAQRQSFSASAMRTTSSASTSSSRVPSQAQQQQQQQGGQTPSQVGASNPSLTFAQLQQQIRAQATPSQLAFLGSAIGTQVQVPANQSAVVRTVSVPSVTGTSSVVQQAASQSGAPARVVSVPSNSGQQQQQQQPVVRAASQVRSAADVLASVGASTVTAPSTVPAPLVVESTPSVVPTRARSNSVNSQAGRDVASSSGAPVSVASVAQQQSPTSDRASQGLRPMPTMTPPVSMSVASSSGLSEADRLAKLQERWAEAQAMKQPTVASTRSVSGTALSQAQQQPTSTSRDVSVASNSGRSQQQSAVSSTVVTGPASLTAAPLPPMRVTQGGLGDFFGAHADHVQQQLRQQVSSSAPTTLAFSGAVERTPSSSGAAAPVRPTVTRQGASSSQWLNQHGSELGLSMTTPATQPPMSALIGLRQREASQPSVGEASAMSQQPLVVRSSSRSSVTAPSSSMVPAPVRVSSAVREVSRPSVTESSSMVPQPAVQRVSSTTAARPSLPVRATSLSGSETESTASVNSQDVSALLSSAPSVPTRRGADVSSTSSQPR